MIKEITEWLESRVASSSFKTFLTDSLVDLCLIDNTPQSELSDISLHEDQSIKYLHKLIAKYVGEGILEERAVNEKIFKDSHYIKPYYTDNTNAYINRCNLIHVWEPSHRSADGLNVGMNAHMDTVVPHIAPSVVDGVVFGRGACDDKGGCINIVAALRLLKEIGIRFGIYPGGSITSMFVIDEETGGNGSLSLSLDTELTKEIDTMIVLEPTNQQIHPANRGAVWYKVEVPAENTTLAVKLMLRIVLVLEETGRKIKEESTHKLFPERPVQTCQGIFGPYGEHPSRVCDRFELILRGELGFTELKDMLECGLQKYLQQYGDNDLIKDHFQLEYLPEGFFLKVFGISGHMAAAEQLDNAIVKAAYITKEICDTDISLTLSLPEMKDFSSLYLEGGQGFLPTHTIQQIEERLRIAVNITVEEYLVSGGFLKIKPEISFNKLRNPAFSCNPESESMQNAIISAELSGIRIKKPVTGFPASCDARLFATDPVNLETLTVGPGLLADAHSNSEKLSIEELAKSCSFLALFILIQTRAIDSVEYL